MRTSTRIATCCASLALVPLAVRAQDPPPKSAPSVDFQRDVQPIFENDCFECHSGAKRRGGLRLDSKVAAFRGGKSGPAVVAGKPESSELLRRVLGEDGKKRMPQGEGPLSDEDVATLRTWIESGANWPDSASVDDSDVRHWAYIAPTRPTPPVVRHAKWCRTPLDAFVAAGFEAAGLEPAPEADRAQLIRRASLDLIGIPPTPEEVADFVRDPSPNAYEKVVDRLLASPRYGERWAVEWLDLARYADTNGYEKDLPRSLWPWRDWVIRAFNADLPYDEFSVKQLAGDLLPNATLDDQVATGFQRNTMLNDEGGIDAEEFRVVAVVDRVNTLATVWLGSTIGCAQCHDHKFDPFTQKEYYQFFAFFNDTEDVGVGFAPTVEVPTDPQRAEQADLRAKIAALDAELAPAPDSASEREWVAKLGRAPAAPIARDHVWSFAAADGATAHDRVATGVATSDGHAMPSDKVKVADSPLGASLALAGDAFVDCAQAVDFERDQAFSYGAWVRSDASGGVLAKIDDPHAYRGFDLFKNQKKFEVHIVHEWPANGIKVETARDVPDGEWMHVCVTYDGSSKASGVALFIDGVAETLHTVNDTLGDSIRNTVSLKLGSREASGELAGALFEPFVVAKKLEPAEIAELVREPLRRIASIDIAKRSDAERALVSSIRIAQDPVLAAKRAERATLSEKLAALPIATTLVMRDRTERRVAHVLERGNFRTPADAVEPATPGCLHPFPDGAPRNRLGLARWLFDDRDPLVARVAMNRMWQALFGTGLVATPEDFGSQGDFPTHPELLDWLAVEFRERGWSQKAMLREILTSATYRQSSRVDPLAAEKDPLDRLLARAPRLRLEGEFVRDNALAIAGLLSPKIGGPSVMPPQPPGIWEGSFATHDTPNEKWTDALGEDRWRRGLYTYWRRSAPYPSSLSFDGSRRDVCVVRRSRTNNPLQALTTLNDPVFVEASVALGKRMLVEVKGTARQRIARGISLCLARAPREDELALLEGLWNRARSRFAADRASAEKLLGEASGIDVAKLDPVELASWCVVANVLLNLDETITKG